MIAAWMLYCTALALLLIGAGLALERALQFVGRPSRWVWVGAMAGSFVLPVVALMKPQAFRPIAIPVAQAPAFTSQVQARPTAAFSTAIVAPRFSIADLDLPLAIAWGTASAALLALGGLAALRLWRLKASWRTTSLEGRIVLVSPDVGPAVTGVPAGRIVVPEWALGLDVRLQRLMLTHEAEHLATGDPWLLVVGAFALVVMPWNAALWWQVRRLRLAIEMDCDARVLRRAPDLADYGELLLSVGRHLSARMPFAPALTEPMSFLERRIRRMTEGRPRRYVVQTLASVAAAGVALAVACEAPRPSVPTDVASSQLDPSAAVTGGGLASTAYDTLTFGHLLPRIRLAYSPLVAHYSGQVVNLWFVEDWRGVVVAEGTAPGAADHSINSEQAPTIVPGFDTLRVQSIALLGYGAVGAGSPPVMWVRLRDPNALRRALRRDLSAVETHPEMVTLPWIRDALRRYHPGLLREQTGPAEDVWFVADREKRVLRTARSPRTPGGIGIDQIMGQFPDLDKEQVNSWMVTNRGVVPELGALRKNVNVIWVQLRR